MLFRSVLMKAFSGKISDSLKDTVSSIANLTGLTKNNLTKTLEETRKYVDNFNGKTNDNSRFIKMLIALFVPELIAMIIIFVLLKNEVINVLMAFIFMIIVFGIMFAIVFGFIRTLLIPIRAAITGVSSDDKGNEKITDKIEKLSARNDDIGDMVRNIQRTFGGFTNTISAIRKATDRKSVV